MTLQSGAQTWSTLANEAGSDFRWVWQDAGGLCLSEDLPDVPPRTSILWGWGVTLSSVARARLDGQNAFVAVVSDANSLSWQENVSWSADSQVDGRIAKHAELSGGQVGPAFSTFRTARLRNEAGATITFVRPAGIS